MAELKDPSVLRAVLGSRSVAQQYVDNVKSAESDGGGIDATEKSALKRQYGDLGALSRISVDTFLNSRPGLRSAIGLAQGRIPDDI